jgi:hypothetical protein
VTIALPAAANDVARDWILANSTLETQAAQRLLDSVGGAAGAQAGIGEELLDSDSGIGH